MNELKHTPGEWNVGYGKGVTGPTCPSTPTVRDAIRERAWFDGLTDEPSIEYEIVSVNDAPFGHKDSSSVVAILPFRDGEETGNAHLVAAAPDLLAACEAALEDLLDGCSDDDLKNCTCPTCAIGIIPQLRAAIAKAKGATQ